MKLYYSPGACSLSTHIVLKESGLAFEAIAAPTKTHKLADGTDYYTINPLGYVPYLVLDDGRALHEGPAIVQYIADQVPDKHLAPPNGTWERYKLQEWLNTIGTELHKGFSPLFTPGMPAEAKEIAKTRLLSRLTWVDGELAGKNLPDGRHLYRGRRLPVCGGGLGQTRWRGHLRFEQPECLCGSRRGTSCRAGGAAGRGPGQITKCPQRSR